MVRDKIVLGVASSKTREGLTAEESNSSMAKTLEIGHTYETLQSYG